MTTGLTWNVMLGPQDYFLQFPLLHHLSIVGSFKTPRVALGGRNRQGKIPYSSVAQTVYIKMYVLGNIVQRRLTQNVKNGRDKGWLQNFLKVFTDEMLVCFFLLSSFWKWAWLMALFLLIHLPVLLYLGEEGTFQGGVPFHLAGQSDCPSSPLH